ncbi:mannose-1-phosphate guanylyltransferase 1-like [Magnolia sinica]|uniref:mannose-1-phosphate guanylyltransferase 1-like n=1 Tax=Magnolia sinica TaxID=86752 RepID=UPI00265B62A0|nr:mannose-1-phosphate guanylyltransferase 1-like [Magnolia sinica]
MKALIHVTGSQRAFERLHDKPMLFPTISRLTTVQEIDEIILAIDDYEDQTVENILVAIRHPSTIQISSLFAKEYSNGGWLAVAKEQGRLTSDGEPFFLLRTNVIVDYPFNDMIEFHKHHGHEATMLISQVDKGLGFNSVLVDRNTRRVEEYFIGPGPLVGPLIDTQIYLFNPSILERDLYKPMILGASILPALAREGNLYSMPLKGPYIDLKDDGYRLGLERFFKYMNPMIPNAIRNNPVVVICGNVWIDATSSVTGDCQIGPDVIIGPDWKINCSDVQHSVLMRNVSVLHYGYVDGCIVASDTTVGPNTAVYPVSVIEDRVQSDEATDEVVQPPSEPFGT